MDGITLWKERATEYWTMAFRYLRYIGNSGFLFSVYVAIILGSYYYSVLLEALPEGFPAIELMTIILFLVVVKGNIRTFIKMPDSIFLLAAEQRLQSYFQKSLLYSFVMHGFIVSVVFLAMQPLYANQVTSGKWEYLGSLLLFILVSGWNLIAKWEELKLPIGNLSRWIPLVRFALILFVLYSAFIEAWLITASLIAILSLLYLFLYRAISTKHTVKWDRLVTLESESLISFFRVANMFVEVPRVGKKVKVRRWATGFINLLNGKESSVYTFMYTRAFIRSNDYFGIYGRLTLIGVVLMVLLPSGILLSLLSLLIIYMSAMQLTTIWPHYNMKVWVDLYPVPTSKRLIAFQSLLYHLLFLQAALFGLSSFFNHYAIVQTLLVLLLNAVLVISFVKVLLNKQLRKRFMN